MRQPLVVRVEERHKFRLCFGDAAVSGGADPRIPLGYQADARIGQSPNDVPAAVGRAVVRTTINSKSACVCANAESIALRTCRALLYNAMTTETFTTANHPEAGSL